MSINDIYDSLVVFHRLLSRPDGEPVDETIKQVRNMLGEIIEHWKNAHKI